MTRKEIIEHMKVMADHAAMDDAMLYVMTVKDLDVVKEAAEILEAQEPKIISLTDVVCAEDGSVVWLETYFDGNTVIEPFLVCVDFTQKPVIINGWNSFINVREKELEDSIISIISDRYKVRKFRFWSAWPTEEQREAVAWE